MMNIPRKKVKRLMIVKILKFFNPEYLNIWIWLSLNKFIKKSCVPMRKINGNISNILFSVRKSDFFEIIIDIEVRDANHLQNIIAALRMEKEVSSLERLKG